jgi:regulator of sigma E protease
MHSLLQVAAVILFIGGLIFVHELGHFMVAKALGVKVLRFSIGFGPRFLGFSRGETEYWLAVFPLGGYVKMAGDVGEDPAKTPPEDRGRGFLEQSPWRRLAISAAGPAMNLVFPFLIFLGLAISQQGSLVAGPYIGTVIPGSPAEAAGLRPGDRILSVAAPGSPARPVRRFGDLREAVSPHSEEPLVFRVQRDGRELPPLTITPMATQDRSNPVETLRRGVIGIGAAYAPALVAPVRPGAAGSLEPFDLVVSAAGKPVRNMVELGRIVASASCAPVDLEVLREDPVALPGANLSTLRPVRLAAVPTCAAGGERAFLAADPSLSTFIGAVDPRSPAARAGLHRGDAITSINGRPVRSLAELAVPPLANEFGDPDQGGPAPEVRIGLSDGRTVTLRADARPFEDELTRKTKTRYVPGFQAGRSQAVNGAELMVEQVQLQQSAAEIVGAAWTDTTRVVRTIFKGIVKLFSRQLSIKTVGGPLTIISMASDAAEEGLFSFFFLMAVISVNLALMNLLPIPVLDGGNIAQALLEAITRRPLSARTRTVAQAVGLALLVMLMIVVFGNDIARKLVGPKG